MDDSSLTVREVPHSLKPGASTQSHPRNVPVGAYVGHFLPRCSLQSQEWLMGSKPPSTIGTTELWRASAFTQGNDLPWNAQTLFGCQCAYRVPALDSRLTVSWLPTEHSYCSSEASWMSICYPVTMDKHTIKPTTVRLEPQDREAIETIKHLYGCPSDVVAMRLAIRMLARREVAPSTPLQQGMRLLSP
jgi:hypothetical protein